VYFGSIGGFLINAGEINRSAIGQVAVAFSAATVLLGIVSYLLPKLIRRMLDPERRPDRPELNSKLGRNLDSA
jgi:hypothetical protein